MPTSADRPGSDWRIVVTGAGGFVGTHLRHHLRARFGAATILSAGREAADDILFDLARAETATAVAAAEPDVIVHLAGEASVAAATHAAAETWRVNLAGTLALAEALAKRRCAPTFLFASSAEVYGAALREGRATEDTPPRPLSVYAQTKLATEQMLTAVLPEASTLIVVRPSNHIGPGQGDRFALPSFAAQIAVGERRGAVDLAVGNLAAERDFLDVRDVVAAYGALLARFHAAGGRLVFNVASGQVRPVQALVDLMLAQARAPCHVRVDPDRVRTTEIASAAISPAAIEAATGWRATTPVATTIADVLYDARRRLGE